MTHTDPDAQPDGRPAPAALDGPPEAWKPALASLLEEKTTLCRRLDALSRSQRDLIERGETDALLALLTDRQDLIGRLRALQESLQPFRARWEGLMAALPADEAAAFQRSIERLAEMVRAILDRDDADRAALDERRKEVLSTMTRVGAGRSALAAYSPQRADGSAPVYHDGEG